MLAPSLSTGMLKLLVSALWVAQLSSAAKQSPVVWTVTQFEQGTWVENIAVRSNNDLLVTLLDRPELRLIKDLDGGSPQTRHRNESRLVHRFPDGTGLLGITEVGKDEFFVITGEFDIPTFTSTTGSYIVWRVKFDSGYDSDDKDAATVTKAAQLDTAAIANGMTTLSKRRGIVLISDSILGRVYALNVRTGRYNVALTDGTLTPPPDAPLPFGVNGVRTRFIGDKAFLYYTNTARATLGRVQVDPNTGKAIGPFTILAQGPEGTLYDDFAIDEKDGTSWIGANPSNVLVHALNNGTAVISLGDLNSTIIAGPASAQFGRARDDRRTLYVVTSGAQAAPVNGTFTEGGKVLGIMVDRLR